MTTDPTDLEIVGRVLSGHTNDYEILMRRYNQRLFRIGVSILHNESEVQEAMQESYIKAYERLKQFEGRAAFGTWLTRILINECLARKNRSRRIVTGQDAVLENLRDPQLAPDEVAHQSQLRAFLESAIQRLPDDYQVVFMMREVENLSGRETAACLQITETNVKVRLHRAKAMLRKDLERGGGMEVFAFRGHRCDSMVQNVLRRIHSSLTTFGV